VIEVREYIDANGRNRYRSWIAELDSGSKARVLSSVLRLGSGNLSGVKSAGAGVCELRLDFGPGYRIYFGRDGEALIVLLAGGTKRRQQADIETAQELWAEYKRRKREA
jgi:putative addiction module killer protein